MSSQNQQSQSNTKPQVRKTLFLQLTNWIPRIAVGTGFVGLWANIGALPTVHLMGLFRWLVVLFAILMVGLIVLFALDDQDRTKETWWVLTLLFLAPLGLSIYFN